MDINVLKNAPTVRVSYINVEFDAGKIATFMWRHQLSITAFANIMGISIKTVEGWLKNKRKSKFKGAVATLFALLEQDSTLIHKIRKIEQA